MDRYGEGEGRDERVVFDAVVGDAVGEEDEVDCERGGPGRRDGREVGDREAEANGDHSGGRGLIDI